MNRLTTNMGLYGNEFEYTPTEIAKYKGDDKLIHTNNQIIYNHLGKIEDIFEKYGIKSVEEVDKTFEYANKLIKAYESGSWKKEKKELQHDRDSWKKACELACGTIISREINEEDYYDVLEKWKKDNDIDMYEIDDNLLSNYFYQQAQKEMK